MFASGLPDGPFKQTVQNSVGSYVGKFYKAYTKGEFDAASFAKAKADLQAAFPAYSSDVADAIMHQHMREVKANTTMFGRLRSGGQQPYSVETQTGNGKRNRSAAAYR
jgi:lauroyl/myristoyl acyltransferase